MIKILQLRDKCIGCNACVEADPFRWRISKNDGKCVLIGGKEKNGWFMVDVPEDEEKYIQQAASNCPVNIIKWQWIKKPNS